MKDIKKGFSTKLIHAGNHKDHYGSPVTPIYQTSTFTFESAEQGAECFAGANDGYMYTRIGNPTIADLENAIAALENGYKGIATSSGMGAISSVLFGLLSKDSHIVSHNALYGPVRGILETYFTRYGVESTFVDASDLENVKKALKTNTKLIYIETPANPTMDIIDIAATAEFAHSKGIPLIVDNTFCSPYLQNPIDLGADIVVHSMTKFINGHADIVGGMIVTKDEHYYKLIRPVMVNLGLNIDPHQAFLARRGLKTLAVRIDKSQDTAMKLAEFLEKHPKVEWIKYPGLKSHPKYNLAKKQMRGPGSMISIELKGGIEAGRKLLNNLNVFLLAVSLGGVESLIQHPASMTHAKMSREEKQKAGITDGLIRLSIGIEDTEDLLEDIRQALEKV